MVGRVRKGWHANVLWAPQRRPTEETSRLPYLKLHERLKPLHQGLDTAVHSCGKQHDLLSELHGIMHRFFPSHTHAGPGNISELPII
jgi:hypothetical protein